eukprot:g35138.t1
MRLRDFFQDISSEPNETNNEPDQLTERSMGEPAKKELDWTHPEGRSPGLDRHAQAVRECVNARFISCTHKVVQNITQEQRNTIRGLKTNRNIGIKSADKGGAIVIQNRTNYCKKYLTCSHLHTSHVGDFYCLPKIHKANAPGCPIVSGNGTLCENLYIKGILKPIAQGTPSFCHNTTDFLQKFSTHGPVEPGTFLITTDVSALYTSIPPGNGIAATASVLNTTNCQFPDAILQLIRFILDHNVFTIDNQFFIQTHRTAMGTKFAPLCANIFMHKFEQDFFAAQNLRPMLYTRYVDDIFFLWTHGKESLKQIHSDINKFHPTIRLTMDYYGGKTVEQQWQEFLGVIRETQQKFI